MILTGPEIKKEIELGNIQIEPYDESNVQPASVDLTLGTGVRVYTSQVMFDETYSWRADALKGENLFARVDRALDPKSPHDTIFLEATDDGFLIKPGILYLMHTQERLHTDKYVSVLDGKSSIGRLGVVVHLTAGYGDPGFNGQYTLEVTCVHPIILYPKMKIAQMRFHTLQGEVDLSYATRGHYNGATARGAIASMAHTQFKEAK